MSAQLEDGYTRIANELLEQVFKTKFNGTQYSIILFVFRNTYGFQRKSHDMSLNFISAGIETHKDQVKRELDKLIEWHVITVFQEASFNKPRVIGINKDTEDWDVQSNEKSIQSAKTSTVSESIEKQSTKKPTPTVDELAHQEKKDFKEIKELYMDFIFLTKKEYENLKVIIGETELEDLMFELNTWLANNAKKQKTTNCNLTLQNWNRRRKKEKSNIKPFPTKGYKPSPIQPELITISDEERDFLDRVNQQQAERNKRGATLRGVVGDIFSTS